MPKYLPEQRLAYSGMAVIILLLIVSGLVKTYKNIYAPDLSHTTLLWATWVHNIAFVLFFLSFLAHMAAIALRPNWPMVRGIFTGKVRLDYARHRHSLWMADLEKAEFDAARRLVGESFVTDGETLESVQTRTEDQGINPANEERQEAEDTGAADKKEAIP